MVQMMQIQGMWYGVEKSLKSLLQEISLKIVVCAGNSHPGSLSLKAKLVLFVLENEIAKVHFGYFLSLFGP